MKRVSAERFFSMLKEFLDLKKLGVYSKKNVKIYAYLISIGMLLTGYINFMLGYLPRSVKIFLGKFT